VRGYATERRSPTGGLPPQTFGVGPFHHRVTGWRTGVGFGIYDGWSARRDSWLWSPYGFWFDPYMYDQYAYWSPGGFVDDRGTADRRSVGAIRLRANPRDARVYIDGAFAGIVDDFDGLTHHLELEPGPHQLELRADGYESYLRELRVEAGRTLTTRVNLTRRR
jgi:hypothetical protein